jgi:ribA/ribD-fused uncharacterized protein
MSRRVERIESFSGEFRFLSNFHPLRNPVVCELRLRYPTVEHAYQASKSLYFDDRREIAQLATPTKAKTAGQKMHLRPHWEELKRAIMLQFLLQKFLNNDDCREWLLETGKATLVEGNHWGDRYWGTTNGTGENHLGILLMQVRELLR